MVHIEKLVPEIYRDSRDFKVFLKLLDIVINSQKYDIDNWTTLYDPLLCIDKFLPLLSDIIGYRYDNTLSVTENRIIMNEFNSMIKNKGSEIGLKIATALSMNAQLASDPESKEYIHAVNQLQFLELYYDYETGIISICYPSDLKKIRDLFKYVRPVGSFIELINAEFPEPESDLAITTGYSYNRRRFTSPDFEGTTINKLQINLDQVERGDSSDRPINYINNYRDVTVNGFTYTPSMIQTLRELVADGTNSSSPNFNANLDFDSDNKLTGRDLDYLRKLLLGIMTYSDIQNEVHSTTN